MANNKSTKKSTKKPLKKSSDSWKSKKKDEKFEKSSTNFRFVFFALAVMVAVVAGVVYMSVEKRIPKNIKVSDKHRRSEGRGHETKSQQRKGKDGILPGLCKYMLYYCEFG